MSTLLIIDVQNSFGKHIDSKLYFNIQEFSKNFSHLVYIWDDLSGQELYSEIPEDWLLSDNEDMDDSFYSQFNTIINKQYSFFRNLMDNKTIPEEDLIKLGKFLIKNNLNQAREIFEDEEKKVLFDKEFKYSPLLNIDFDSDHFELPQDLVESLSNLGTNLILVGGGRNECLKEISLLLDIMEIPHSIHEELTY